MRFFVNVTLSGVANGVIFAALALALVFIWRATRTVNFAQGAMGMMTTFIAFSLLQRGLGYWEAFVASLAIGFLMGAVVEVVLVRPLHGKPQVNPVIVTVGLLVVLEGAAGSIWGTSSRGFPAAFSQSGLRFGHTSVAFSHFNLFMVIAVLVLMVATLALFRGTKLGGRVT